MICINGVGGTTAMEVLAIDISRSTVYSGIGVKWFSLVMVMYNVTRI